MMTAGKLLGWAVGLALLGGSSVLLLAAGRWERTTRSLVDRLGAEAFTIPPTDPSRPVPTPVARHLANATPRGGVTVAASRLRQSGEFRQNEAPDGWRPFTATEFFRAHPPAFVWDARIRMAPLVDVRVRDAYVNGRGSTHARLWGIVTVADADGDPALAAGALYRYLAEAPWLPGRLAPAPDLEWTAVDDSTALATLTDAGVSVTVRFRFDELGDVTEIYAPDRPRQVEGGYESAPWIGRFRDHRVVDGFRIPFRGEVAWVTGEGEQPYWRGSIEAVELDLKPERPPT